MCPRELGVACAAGSAPPTAKFADERARDERARSTLRVASSTRHGRDFRKECSPG